MKDNINTLDAGLISKAKKATQLCDACPHYSMVIQPWTAISLRLTPKEKWKIRSHVLRWERRYKKAYEMAETIEGKLFGIRFINGPNKKG